MGLIRKLSLLLAFLAVGVFAIPDMPSSSIDKTQSVLQAKAKSSKKGKKGKKSKKKKEKSAELQALEAGQAQEADQDEYADQDQGEDQSSGEEQDAQQESGNDSGLEAAFEEVQQDAQQKTAEPAPETAQAAAKPAPQANSVNPAVLNTKPGQQSFILKNGPATAPAATGSQVAATEPEPSATEPKDGQYVNRFKKMRQKKSVAEYESVQNAKRDSILNQTYHFGISAVGGRTHDKRLGDLDVNSKWGGDFGLYLFYRHYFNDYVAMQGRLGAMFRYARFKDETLYEDKLTFGDEKYDINDKMTVAYSNIAIDAPLSLKVGGHVEHTSFLFISLTGGITKSMYDHIKTNSSLTVKDPSKELSETLDELKEKGRYPIEESRTTAGNFYVDDWEFNSWLGAGVDGKYVSLEYQVLIAASSTKDNHRYHNLFHGNYPTWRVMVDFSLK